MAVTAGVLTETQRRALEAVCDTFVPSVEADTDDPVRKAYLARSASDLGVPAHLEGLMGQAMVPEEIEGVGRLLDVLAQQGLPDLPPEHRLQLLRAVAASSPEAGLGISRLKGLTMLFFYGLPDEQGRNPNWEAIGFPGPVSMPPSPEQAPKTLNVEQVSGETATLSADVVVVGSGAGGGVIAAELAQGGKSVLILEQGPYHNEQEFNQLELPGTLQRYLGGGLLSTESGSVAIYAGATVGGGTIVNYMNCIRTPEHILEEWASHGLEGLDQVEYQQHIDAIWDRLTVNQEATHHNRQHHKLIAAWEASGMPWKPITRNADRECDDPDVCGFCFTGCQKGCKQSTMKTFLQDASDAGARLVPGCRVEKILTADGRATGVGAIVRHPDGSTTQLIVEAPTVVVAAGAIESPALLLRSGIGGPAAGKHLRLHPAVMVNGIYDEPVEAWNGQAQSAVSYHFADVAGEHQGFLIESVPFPVSTHAVGFPFENGAQHKEEYSRAVPHIASFITVARDHGSGEVGIDGYGRAVPRYDFYDQTDRELLIRANTELAKLHHAAGAKEIYTLHTEPLRWREGQDFDHFLESVESAAYEALDVIVFSAHQMGSCRMGSDPSDYVADGRGELHDTGGVWIGDASAFPTAPGVNPMISIMALARRTAGHIAAAGR